MAQGYGGVPAGPLSAYLSVRDRNEERGMGELQQAGAVQGLLARMQAEQRQKQFQDEIAIADTPEKQLAVAMKYGAPRDVLAKISASKDRAEAIRSREALSAQTDLRQRELVAQQDLTRRELAAQADATRREIAANRPQPQPPSPIVQTDDQGNTRIYDRSGNLVKDLGNRHGTGMYRHFSNAVSVSPSGYRER
jgi:hypothetical protein